MDTQRRGASLLELLIVVAILAVLIGLLLPGVQKVRDAAARAASTNNMRQITLALGNYTSNTGKLPGWESLDQVGWSDVGLLHALLPYVEQANYFSSTLVDGSRLRLKLFISPADPTAPSTTSGSVPLLADNDGNCSYAGNAVTFEGMRPFPGWISDGTSNTLAFVERYSNCGESGTIFRGVMRNRYDSGGTFTPGDRFPPVDTRRATFADRHFGDRVSVTRGNPPVASSELAVRPWSHWAARPNAVATFQVRPHPSEADHRVPQTPHQAMITAWFDGSVRTITGSVSPAAYWGAVTPAGGEAIHID